MFDWQAELAPPALNHGIKTSSPLAIVVAPPHVKPTVAAPIQTNTMAPKPFFAQALRGNTVISDPLPVPFMPRETLSVKITDEVYVRGIDYCKIYLRGQLMLNKGDKPYSSKNHTAKLQKLWKV